MHDSLHLLAGRLFMAHHPRCTEKHRPLEVRSRPVYCARPCQLGLLPWRSMNAARHAIPTAGATSFANHLRHRRGTRWRVGCVGVSGCARRTAWVTWWTNTTTACGARHARPECLDFSIQPRPPRHRLASVPTRHYLLAGRSPAPAHDTKDHDRCRHLLLQTVCLQLSTAAILSVRRIQRDGNDKHPGPHGGRV